MTSPRTMNQRPIRTTVVVGIIPSSSLTSTYKRLIFVIILDLTIATVTSTSTSTLFIGRLGPSRLIAIRHLQINPSNSNHSPHVCSLSHCRTARPERPGLLGQAQQSTRTGWSTASHKNEPQQIPIPSQETMMMNSSHFRHNSLPNLHITTSFHDSDNDDADNENDNDNEHEPETPNTKMHESYLSPNDTFRRSSLDSEQYAGNGSQSPRSLMAGQLSRMELDEGATGFGGPLMVKRRKRTSTLSSAGSAMDTDEGVDENTNGNGDAHEHSEDKTYHNFEENNSTTNQDHNKSVEHRLSRSLSPKTIITSGSTSSSPQKEYTWSSPRPPPRKAPTKQKKSKDSKPRARFLSFDPLSTSPPKHPLSTKKRSKSPPPSYNSLTFSPSEITGTNPTDPTDDMTGINGIGFRATPSMAYQRSQKRMQQIAEWKRRVAVEERGRRIEERRRGKRGSGSSIGSSGSGAGAGAGTGGIRKGRVKWFDEVGKN